MLLMVTVGVSQSMIVDYFVPQLWTQITLRLELAFVCFLSKAFERKINDALVHCHMCLADDFKG